MPKVFPIIARLGGRAAVHTKLVTSGRRVGADAVRMWEQRGSMPGDFMQALMEICEAEGVAYSSSDFAAAERSAAPKAA